MSKARYAMLFLGCAVTPLCADGVKASNAPQEEDTDLFRKDKRVGFINAEFLYWNVNESGNEYALKMENEPWSQTVNTFATGDYKSADFEWDPGVRVSMGYFNAPHYWDVYAQYIYLHASGHDETHAPQNGNKYLVGTWIGPDFNDTTAASPLRKAGSTINFYYNVGDFLFSRRFHPNPHLRINFLGGVTGAFIHQKWKVRYENLNDEHSHVQNKWHFGGGGFRLGLKVYLYLGWDLYFSGLASGALFGGIYENKARQSTSATVAGADNEVPFLNTKYEDVRVVYNTQLMAGPSWQKAFERVRTEIFVGYEFNLWTNLHSVYRSNASAPQAFKTPIVENSNVGLQGLTVRWNLDY